MRERKGRQETSADAMAEEEQGERRREERVTETEGWEAAKEWSHEVEEKVSRGGGG